MMNGKSPPLLIGAQHGHWLAKACHSLRDGGLCALPTETVYGLGADARNPDAVARIYEVKARPHFNPLIAHVAHVEAALQLGEFPNAALKLARAFWPGPLTLVVPFRDGAECCELARAGLHSIAIRVPDHPTALALLEAFNHPVVAPSANRSGRISPTTAAHVKSELSAYLDPFRDCIIDGGSCRVGLESTIIACFDEKAYMLREGGITRAEAEAVLGFALELGIENPNAPRAPGQLESHYAPRAAVRLNVSQQEMSRQAISIAYLDFGAGRNAPQISNPMLYRNLSPSGDLREAASHLYAYLRLLDETGAAIISVAPIPETGLGSAINDRLRRAAAAR